MEAVRSSCDPAAGRVAGPSAFLLLTSVASVEAASKPTCRLPRAGDGPCQRGGGHRGRGLTLRSSWCRDFRALRTSSSSAVPLPCHSQRSRPVLSGQPQTTPPRPRPAPFSIVAGGNPARSGFGSRGSGHELGVARRSATGGPQSSDRSSHRRRRSQSRILLTRTCVQVRCTTVCRVPLRE
jgi:hypothetical protein